MMVSGLECNSSVRVDQIGFSIALLPASRDADTRHQP